MELNRLLSTVMPLPAVTLTFHRLTQKPSKYVWPDFGKISYNSYGDIAFTWLSGSSPVVTLMFDLLNPKSNQNLQTKIHLWPKLSKIPLIGFWDMVFTRFSGYTDTDSLTDGHTQKQNASRTEGFRCWIHKSELVMFLCIKSDIKLIQMVTISKHCSKHWQHYVRANKSVWRQTLVQMSMLPTGTVLPRSPLRCSFKFSDKNRSMSIYNVISATIDHLQFKP